MERVAQYYHKLINRGESQEAAFAYTLEMFEGLTEAQVNYAIYEYGCS